MRRVWAAVLVGATGWGLGTAPAAADGVDPTDLPQVGLGDAASRVSWASPLLAEVERRQRPYVSPFQGACQTEACFREGASSHALVHGPTFLLGVAPITSYVRGGLAPELIAPPPSEPSALGRLLE